MILTEQVYLELSVTAGRLASENYAFRDMIVALNAKVAEQAKQLADFEQTKD